MGEISLTVKVVIATMAVSLLICIVTWALIDHQKKTLTFKDLDEHFFLIVAYTTAIYAAFFFGVCGFCFWPMYYVIEFIFKR